VAVPQPSTGDDEKGMADVVGDLWVLLRDYARQETVDPLRNLQRFAAWGTVGSLVVGIGVTILVIGVLRLVQTETGTALTGTLSWVPYVGALALSALGTVLSLKAIKKQGRPG
jgi:hypothetical protein